MAKNDVVVDWETLSDKDVTDCGSWRYAEDPTTSIACLGYRGPNNPKPKLWKPGDPVDEIAAYAADPSLTFVAFNCAFERAVWQNIFTPVFGVPEVGLKRWHDIQATAAMKGLPQNLDDLASELRLDHQKNTEYRDALKRLNEFNKKTGQQVSGQERDDLLALVYLGCLQDIEVEWEANERLGPLPPNERIDWLLTQKTNEMGVYLDMKYVAQCQKIVDEYMPALMAEFKQLTGLKPSQGVKFIDWLQAQGIDVPANPDTGRPSLGKEGLKAWIGTPIVENEDDESSQVDTARHGLPVPIFRALRIRQLVGSSSISKLARMVSCVSSDHRSRGLLHWHGTGPGRAAGRLWQPHNLPKPTLKIDGDVIPLEKIVPALMTGDHAYVAANIGPPIEAVAGGLRHAMMAAPGRAYVSGDYAGIQARLVLALAGQTDKVQMMAAGKDVYIDMGSLVFGRPIDKHRDPWERGIGKNSVLGLGFQMAALTFCTKYVRWHPILDAFEDRVIFCRGVVKTYRKEWAPMVPPLWYGLEEAASETVYTGKPHMAYGVLYQIEGEWLTALLPSNGKIWYYHPTKYFDTRFYRQSFYCLTLEGGRLVTDNKMFGGRLTENVIMRMEHDLMTVAKAKCEMEGLPVVLEVHDEILIEPEVNKASEKILKQIMLDLPKWAKDLQVPINIDTWIGDRYRKG